LNIFLLNCNNVARRSPFSVPFEKIEQSGHIGSCLLEAFFFLN